MVTLDFSVFDDFDFPSLVEPVLLDNFVTVKKEVLDNKQPFGMIIDGIPGTAKTTNAGILARCIQSNFREDKQIGQGIDAFIKAFNFTVDGVRAKYKVCVYDEANDSDKSESLNRIQRILNRLLVATVRQEKIIIIIVLHRFYRLNEKFVDNSLVHMCLHNYSKSNDKYVRFKVYDIDCMLHMLSMLKRGKVLKKPKVYSTTAPNFGGSIKAPPVEYIKMMDAFSKSGKDFLRKKATRDILASNYYTVSVLASMLQVSKSQVNYQISENDFKKQFLREKSGRIFYYDKDLFPVLKRIFAKLEERKNLLKQG